MPTSEAMLEREAATRAVTNVLGRLRRGAGGVLFISGAAGMGKTTTLAFARERAAPDIQVGFGCGDAMETSVPFGLLADVVQAVGGPEVLSAVSRRPWAGDVRAARFYEVSRWLQDIVSGPVLLALDDLHWADPDSLALLSFLCRRIGSSPVAVIATLRPWPRAAQQLALGLVQAGHATLQRLAPLTENAARSLLNTRLRQAVDDRLAEDALRLSAGNPLLLEQVAEATARGDSLSMLTETPSAGAEGLLLTRFAGLPAAGMRYAQAASVLGVRFRPEVAVAVARLAEAETTEALDSLHRSGLAVDASGGWSRFAHPLFARALYDDLAVPIRTVLHRRAFAALVERGLEAEAAEHALRSDLGGSMDVVRVLQRTGAAALRTGGLAAAARHLVAAVELAGDRADSRLLSLLGEALLAAGRAVQAISVYDRVLTHEDLPLAARIDTLRMLARAHFAVGAHQAARAQFEQAAELARTDHPAAAVDVLLDDAVASRITVGPARSLRLIGRAEDLGHRLDARARRRIDVLYAWAKLQAGHAQRCGALDADLRTVAADPIGQLSNHGWGWDVIDAYGNIAIATERFDDARALLVPTLDAAERAGAVEAAAALSIGNAVLLSRTGPLDRALEHARRAVELAELVPMIKSFAGLAEAQILMDMGRCAEGTRCCASAESTATGRGEHLVLPWVWHLRAQQCFHAGRVAEACDLYDRIAERSAQMGIGDPCLVLWARHAIACYLADRRIDAAGRLIVWLEQCENQKLSRWPAIAAATGRAWRSEHEGDHDAAVRYFRTALELHHDLELPMEKAETLLAYGAFLRRQGRPTEARAPLADALCIAEQNQAGRIATAARDELSIAGGRRRRASGSAQLTAQERRVAELAAAGRTNKQIAGTLSVSVKTVEYHLQRIYGKLGLNSRRQLMTMSDGTLSNGTLSNGSMNNGVNRAVPRVRPGRSVQNRG